MTRDELIEKVKNTKYNNRNLENIKLIDEYLVDHSDDSYIKVLEARNYMSLGNIDKAREILLDVVYEDGVPSALSTLGTLEFDLGNYKKAISYYESFFAYIKGGKYIEIRRKLSQAYLKCGEYEKALGILTFKVLNTLELKVARAEVYMQMNQYEKALEVLEEVETEDYVNPSSPGDKRRLQGDCYVKLKKYDEAIAMYEKAMRKYSTKSRKYYDSELSLALVYQLLGDSKKMIEECENILMDCGNAKILNKTNDFLGSKYLDLDEPLKALECFNRCSDFTKLLGHARVEYFMGNFEYAKKLLISIPTKTNGEYKDVHILLAQTLFRLKDYKGFKDEYFILDKTFKDKNGKKIYTKDLLKVEYMRVYLEKMGYTFICRGTLLSDYNYSQLQNYDSTLMLDHIKTRNHLSNKCLTFAPDTDIESLYYYILENLDDTKKRYDGIADIYVMDLSLMGCPYSDSLISISCMCDSHDVLTMYPMNYRIDSIQATPKEIKKAN